MIVLDTNVLSESLKPTPSEAVLQWLAAQELMSVFVTAIKQAELLYELERLPAGKRRLRLSGAIEKLFSEEFPGRILPFDEDTARVFAKIVSVRESMVRPISQFDAMIAAICRFYKATIATRTSAISSIVECGS